MHAVSHQPFSQLLSGLNQEQRTAVLAEHMRVLVLAGAGAGKTKTLIQKILYLVFEKNVKPSSILAITFTKNAANEMIDRLIAFADKSGEYERMLTDKRITTLERDQTRRTFKQRYAWINALTVATFHGLGYGILRSHVAKHYDNRFKIISDKLTDEVKQEFEAKETPDEIIQKILKELCEERDVLLDLKRYVLDYYVDAKTLRQRDKEQGYPQPRYTTLAGDQVRSKSERMIADWLYAHDIKYVYEPKLNLRDFPFKPDFYIPEADLYLEHISNKSFDPTDKDIQFKLAGKNCVKTYEKWTQDVRFFHDKLEEFLRGRVKHSLGQVPPLKFEDEFRSYHVALKQFRYDARRVIDKVKVEGRDFETVQRIGITDKHDRVSVFYRLLRPIWQRYEQYCIASSYLDFNDILIKLMEVLRDDVEVRSKLQEKYQHILVDEYQDVNSLQVRMVDTLLTPTTKLFCVGDDWQSIYGFRGSEVEHIVGFRQHYPDAEVIRFTTNYRSSSTIVDASNALIAHNKRKLDKSVSSSHPQGCKIQVYCAQDESADGVEMVVKTVKDLYENGFSKDDVLVLFRRSLSYEPYREAFKNEGLRVNARTVHSSKGLEARVVIIIGLTEKYFPNVWENDRIFQLVKKDNIELMMEEERRLFYVAVTRAKEALYLISELGNESRFIEELSDRYLDRKNFLTISNKAPATVCNSCNNELDASDSFCSKCGKSIRDEQNGGQCSGKYNRSPERCSSASRASRF
jgi:DNA helicase-4